MKSRVRSGGVYSEQFSGIVGLRQGESSSPLLFSFVINELENKLKTGLGGRALKWDEVFTTLSLYADDGCIICQDSNTLKRGLVILSEFCSDWNLSVNTSKTEIIVFGRPEETREEFMYNGDVLKQSTTFTYLGIIEERGGWDINAKTLLSQARKAIVALRRKIYSYYFNPGDKYRLFNQLIEPILSYGAEVWNTKAYKNIEVLHRSFMRECLMLRKSCRSDILYAELGAIPLSARRNIKMIGFWVDMTVRNTTKLSSVIYRKLRNSVRRRWTRAVERILTDYGYGDLWENGPWTIISVSSGNLRLKSGAWS